MARKKKKSGGKKSGRPAVASFGKKGSLRGRKTKAGRSGRTGRKSTKTAKSVKRSYR